MLTARLPSRSRPTHLLLGLARRGGIVRPLVVTLVLVGLLLLGVWQFWPRLSLSAAADGPLTVQVERGLFVHEITERGEVESASSVEVRCEVESKGSAGTTILEIVPEGTQVQQGDVIARLDSSALESELTQQQIVCNTSKAAVIKARSDYETALIAKQEYLEGQYKQEVQTIQSEIFVAEEDLRRAREYLAYSERLAARGYVTALQLEADRFAVEKAQNELDKAKTKLDVLERFTRAKMIKQLEADIATTEAALRSKEDSYRIDMDELQRIKDQIEHCTITAPEPGQVVYANVTSRRGRQEVLIEPGTQIRENQVIVRLPDPQRMQVEAEINEANITMVALGMQATVQLDAFPDMVLPGTVKKVNEYPEPNHWFTSATKEYATLVAIDESPVALRPGLTAEVKILVRREPNVLMLPVQAVFQHGEAFYCAVPSPDGYRAQKVTLGSSNDNQVIIRAGLDEGDTVALGAAMLRDELDLPELKRKQSDAATVNGAASEDIAAGAGSPGTTAGPATEPGPSADARPAPADGDARFAQLDRNGDGKLQRDEVPEPMRPMFGRVDANSDGAISRAELQQAFARMRQGGGPPGGGPPPGPANGD